MELDELYSYPLDSAKAKRNYKTKKRVAINGNPFCEIIRSTIIE